MLISEKLAEAGFSPVCYDMATDRVISTLDGERFICPSMGLQVHHVEGVAVVKTADLRILKAAQ